MILPKPLHAWQMSAKEAIQLQKKLAEKVIIGKPSHSIRRVAGLDAAFTKDKKTCIAAVVIWDIKTKSVIESQTATHPVYFPYIPGLLSFREAPALLNALAALTNLPDVLMCDGQGIAHQRGLGIASHLGIFTGLTSFGCGKSRLVGTHAIPPTMRGGKVPLEFKGKVVGSVLRTKTDVKPIYVSVGHQIDLASAEEVTLECFNGYRLPEPTRLADKLVAHTKASMIHE